MLKEHEAALNAVNESYHLFLLRYKQDAKVVYGIVEGKDDPIYYRSLIERFIPELWSLELIPAGNKKNVIDMLEALDWSVFSSRRVAFFVDRDLSVFTGDCYPEHENIYITDGYSIENAVVNQDVFYRILVEAYNVVDATEDEKKAIIARFKRIMDDFAVFMSPIMAQILGWRKNRERANLDNLNIGGMISFDSGEIVVNDRFRTPQTRIEYLCACVGARQYDEEDLSILRAEFEAADGPAKFIRGKYLTWLLAKSVIHIHSNICYFVSSYPKPPKIRNQVCPDNIMVSAAPRARIPTTLREFLERTFLAYIAGIECAR